MNERAIRALIAEHFGVAVECATDDALFQPDLGADSLDLVELTILLEIQLGVDIADDESEGCQCVGDAIRLLRRKLALI